jgi:gliding motility-associated-like protein
MNKFLQLLIFLLFVNCISLQLHAQQIRNTYRFFNTLSTTEPTCAEDLIPAKGLNVQCQPTTAATSGQFITDTISSSNIIRAVYKNNLNWGLKYLNTNGVINKTYTIQLYVKVVNFNKFYTRIIDLSDGVEDDGIYFTNFNTPAPTNNRCLNFYPNGNFGVCPFFNNSTYYLLTFTRNDITKLIDIYVNDQLFTSYNDAAGFYTSTAGKPVHIFRDDPIGFACEDGEANFAYLSFANFYSSQADVSLIYQNLNALVNTVDFSVSNASLCTSSAVVFNYTGNIPTGASQYLFNWNWDGGAVISGTGRGPYVVQWNTTGIKNIVLTISGGGCTNNLTNSKQVSITQGITTKIDTSICPGNSYEGHTTTGQFIDTFIRPLLCDSIRTVNLSFINLETPNLGNTQSLCAGDSIILNPGNFTTYLWQDGSTQKLFTAKKAGVYSVTVTNKCTSTRTQVQIKDANCSIYFPNTFTPNKDGKNDKFKILTERILYQYQLVVYNRYGQKIFETTNQETGWDGKLNGDNIEQGLYVWVCSFKKSSTEVGQFLRGTIMLAR